MHSFPCVKKLFVVWVTQTLQEGSHVHATVGEMDFMDYRAVVENFGGVDGKWVNA